MTMESTKEIRQKFDRKMRKWSIGATTGLAIFVVVVTILDWWPYVLAFAAALWLAGLFATK